MGALEDLRELNRLRVIDALRLRGTASRAEIAEAVGLSRTTITAVVADLLTSGVVVERHVPRGSGTRRGRPAAMLALDASAGAAIGIDFGHRHLQVAIADLSSTVLAERRVGLDPLLDAHAALDEAAALARSLLTEIGVGVERVIGAGMGLPGPIDPRTAMLRPTAILGSWAGLHVAPELAGRLRIPVTVENDANLGALAETQLGAARGREGVIYRAGGLRDRCRDRPRRTRPPGRDRDRRGDRPRAGPPRRRPLPLREPRLPRDGRVDGRDALPRCSGPTATRSRSEA